MKSHQIYILWMWQDFCIFSIDWEFCNELALVSPPGVEIAMALISWKFS